MHLLPSRKPPTSVLFSGAAALALLLAGCATTPRVATHADPEVDFANYHTFALVSTYRAPPKDPDMTPQMIRAIRDTTAQGLEKKGLTRTDEDKADMVVLVHTSTEQKLDVTDWGFGYYGRRRHWSYWMGGPYDVREYDEGTIIVDVFDGKTRDLIWRGSAVGEVSGEPDVEGLRETVALIVDRFPG